MTEPTPNFFDEQQIEDALKGEGMSRKWRRGMQMDKEQYGKAKACLVSCMQEGYSWQVAKAVAGLQISQSSAYRLWRAFRQCGEGALSDRRHGHPSKLRGAAQAFLEERCRQAPQTPSSTIQMELRERFDLCVSISQINRVRAAFGVSNHTKCPEPGKKRREREALSLNRSGMYLSMVLGFIPEFDTAGEPLGAD